jgi:hypothetical protein
MDIQIYMQWKLIHQPRCRRWWKQVSLLVPFSNIYWEIPHSDAQLILTDDNGQMGSMLQDLAFSIPGVDEAMGFAEIMK